MSKFLTLNQQDLIKWFIIAIGTSVLMWTANLISTGWVISTDSLKVIWLAWLSAWIVYLAKNLTTNSQWNIGKSEQIPTAEFEWA